MPARSLLILLALFLAAPIAGTPLRGEFTSSGGNALAGSQQWAGDAPVPPADLFAAPPPQPRYPASAAGRIPPSPDLRMAPCPMEGDGLTDTDGAWMSEPSVWAEPWQPRKSFPPCNWFRCGGSDPDSPRRALGKGHPLQGTSWRNRPLYMGWFVGGILGDELVAGQLKQGNDLFGGYRAGIDFDHYWGGELRIAAAHPDLYDSLAPLNDRSTEDWFWDVNFLYYPWGDAAWRPYLSAGLGITTLRYEDSESREFSESFVSLPIGAGLKYYALNWLAVRFDVTENLRLGDGRLGTLQNFSFSSAIEIHFGGNHRRYWGW